MGTVSAQSQAFDCTELKGVAAFDTIVSEAEEINNGDGRAYCLVRGVIEPRVGTGGRTYGTGFELRMPLEWSGRFLFQGGGGNDGLVRPAVGVVDRSKPAATALDRGFAVASTDSGHTGDSPTDGWFRIDAKAVADHGENSVRLVTERTRDLMYRFYGDKPKHSYFMGCSNGGRQGMKAALTMPDSFDGIIAGAPAFTISPRVLGWHWAVQSLAKAAPDGIAAHAFTDQELETISEAAVAACDGEDGVEDGLVFRPMQCRFDPSELQCRDGQSTGCLRPAQVAALKAFQQGPVDKDGTPIYHGWPLFDIDGKSGIRAWLLGTSESTRPNSRAYLFLESLLDKSLEKPREDFGVETFGPEDHEWLLSQTPPADASSTNYQAFADAGGKILWYHGAADPAFSVRHFLHWLEEFRTSNPDFAQFSRAYVVPGMHHCADGPGLVSFDLLEPMVSWVEADKAPDAIMAKTADGLERPLCDYPAYAAPSDGGFVCGE